MGRKRKDRPLPKKVPALIHRIEWLLKEKWENNIAYMARDLKVSHAALSRVLRGQMPSGKMLEALARRADVDAQWLLAGDANAPPGRGIGATLLPIADALLPGPPQACPERLSPAALPVASPLLLENAYWYRVRPDDPIASDESSRVVAGDYLLIEASERWTRRPEAFCGRTVVLRMPDESVLLGKVPPRDETGYEDEPQYEVRMVSMPARKGRLFTGRTRESLRSKPPKLLTARADVLLFGQDDVVGVYLQLVRMAERQR
jgi:hypothetical protein